MALSCLSLPILKQKSCLVLEMKTKLTTCVKHVRLDTVFFSG